MGRLRNVFAILLIMSLAAGPLCAQDNGGGSEAVSKDAFNKGDHILSFGVSFLNYGYGYAWGGRSTSVPPLQVSYEVGTHENISIGGFFGFARWTYDSYYGGYDNEWNYTVTQFGVKGAFHYLDILNEEFDAGIDADKFDLYVNLYLGYEIRNMNADFEYDNRYVDTDGRLLVRPNLGGRYMFADNVGIFLETGYGTFGFGRIGISGRF